MGSCCSSEKGPKVETGSRGEKIYRYPSGNVAAVISAGGPGTGTVLSTFFEDSEKGRVLCSYSNQGPGVGNIYYSDGKPR
jgi:hypothetical protein